MITYINPVLKIVLRRIADGKLKPVHSLRNLI